jgi:hypothetical protein
MIFMSLLRSMDGQFEPRGTATAHVLHMPDRTLMQTGAVCLLMPMFCWDLR